MPVKPQRVIWDLRQALAGDDILISDVGAHKVWLGLLYPASRPNTVVISNGFATMGIAVPGGLRVPFRELPNSPYPSARWSR
jgi:acetolactate synthase-1/2/3 large subunit